MTPEQRELRDALRDTLRSFKAEVISKNERRDVADNLSDFDRGGKIFEAFLVMRLKRYFQQMGAHTEIRDASGNETDVLLLRGGPGYLRRATGRRVYSTPGHISVSFPEGALFELHNSVEWPDHVAGGSETHELDVSMARTEQCDALVRWYRRRTDPPSPSLGLEAKFHGREPVKELARSVTGLALRLGVALVYLVTSTVPGRSIMRQLESLKGQRLVGQPVADAAALSVRLVNGEIDASDLVRIVDNFIGHLGNSADPEATGRSDLERA